MEAVLTFNSMGSIYTNFKIVDLEIREMTGNMIKDYIPHRLLTVLW